MIFWSLLLVFACLACGVNGDTLYFTSDRDGNKEIYSTILGTGEEHNLTNTAEEEYGVILSPDRQKILFLVDKLTKNSQLFLCAKTRIRCTLTMFTNRAA